MFVIPKLRYIMYILIVRYSLDILLGNILSVWSSYIIFAIKFKWKQELSTGYKIKEFIIINSIYHNAGALKSAVFFKFNFFLYVYFII